MSSSHTIHPWHSVALSAAGRVPLAQNESLARVQARVGLYSADFRHPHPLDNGSAQVTSHRLLFIPAGTAPCGMAIHLSDIRQSSFSQGFLRSSPKITLHVHSSPTSTSATTSATTADKPKPPPQLPWTCHICQHAHLLPAQLARDSCSLCGNRRPPSLPCPSCTFANPPGSSSCTMCGSSLATPPTSPVANASAGGATVTCTRCTLINPLSAASCAACGSALPSIASSNLSAAVDPTAVVMIKLSFRGGGEKGFHQALLAAMRARAWDADQVSSPSSSPTSRSAAGRGVDSSTVASSTSSPTVKPLGLSGIVAKQEQEQRTHQSALSTAFSDLDALMSKAQDMVTLSSTIAAKLKRSTSSSSSTADTTPDSLISEFRTYLLSLGATSTLASSELAALGKRATGDDRDRALAREVGDFLLHVLPTRGGLLSMGDVYCMFNRARGVALVSPQDLWMATQMFEAVGVPVRARELESGARVLHTDRFEDKRVFEELTRWLTEDVGHGAGTGWVGLSALEVAERLGGGVSVALARQLLEHAVRAGVVVVDVPGSRYYVNVWNDQVVGKR